ncbi:MAG: hypothetical protein ABI776_02745 [Nocardioidaceae bacterium]
MSDPGRGGASARPRQATVGGVMATIACLLLIFTLFDAMSRIRSSDTRDKVREVLSSPPGSSLGLGVDGVLDVMRGVVLLSGGLAAAGAILAVYALRRHRGARVGLSVVAVVMLFSTTFVAGLLPVVVAFATVMLWSRDARDWFDGRPPRTRSQATRSAGTPPPVPPVPPVPRPTMAAWQPPAQQPAQQPTQQPTQAPAQQPFQPPAAPLGAWPPALRSAVPTDSRRPVAVTVAVLLTWVSCALAVLLGALLVVVLLTQRTELLDAVAKDPDIAAAGYTSEQILGGLWVFAAMAMFWALSAAALAVLALRRVRAGQLGLVVSAGLAAVVGLLTIIVPVAAIATVVLLLRGSSNRWFMEAGRQPSNQPPIQPPAGPSDGPRDRPLW